MGTGVGLRNGHLDVVNQRAVILNDRVAEAVLAQHTTVAVVSELIQAGVGHDQNVIPELVAETTQGTVEYALRIPGLRALAVLVRIQRDTEEVNCRDTCLNSLAHSFYQGVLGMLHYPGQGADWLRLINPICNKHGQDEIFRSQCRLRRHRTHHRVGAQPAWATNRERKSKLFEIDFAG